ncbi:SepM family pheromone-processing serine protease [Filibacter tadaridae]|uniref:endopeptidase La n=1 Tax=Filibacter tadaridae TaxID=2483811 RepID=A0A3P5XM21_9BACL|nr:SepM family pheromone-processing serine protease [Filibacter tadaridae]VDC29860.1 Lon protease [Filibacter tadaridae]
MSKKKLGLIGLLLVIIAILFIYPLETYISKPGGAYELAPLVEVADGDEDDTGSFSLMTVSIAEATPFTYLASKFSKYQEVLPVEKVRRSGESDKEYNVRQKRLMSGSQFNAITQAFKKAGLPVDITYEGVFVMNVLKGGAADGILEVGDKIQAIDGEALLESGQFFTRIDEKKLADKAQLTIERNEKKMDVTIELKEIPKSDGRVGLGVRFQEDHIVKTDPKVDIHIDNIGGPSAGLMFTLEIMDQLLEQDMTKGYKIAGTGEMLEDGTVGRIGGIDFKIVAADRQDIEIFFAPDDEMPDEVRVANPGIMTNYEEAVKTAKEIGTKMKIVPVKTVDDALDYLKTLSPK